MVLPLARGGDLMRVLLSRGRLDLGSSLVACCHLCDALRYLHHACVAHRDVKPDNVVCRSPEYPLETVQLADFGFATCCPAPCYGCESIVGTPMYWLPEFFLIRHGTQSTYGWSCDNWSLGVSLYSLLCGEFPFNVDPLVGTDTTVPAQSIDELDDAWLALPRLSRTAIRGLLDLCPCRRLDAVSALRCFALSPA
eukprot:528741-Alexandrium_andersonii.AAC.1